MRASEWYSSRVKTDAATIYNKKQLPMEIDNKKNKREGMQNIYTIAIWKKYIYFTET